MTKPATKPTAKPTKTFDIAVIGAGSRGLCRGNPRGTTGAERLHNWNANTWAGFA